MTAIANDISYDDVFSYQLNRFGKANDVLFAFSVSGTSKNIIKCAKIAKKKKIKIISFTGFNGGKLKKLSKHNINFSSNNFGIVEDCHSSMMHIISQFIRNIKIKSNNYKNINF
jgi:D-sedoheptulose 7-phosphate isomerase